jgi:hypothetical protein
MVYPLYDYYMVLVLYLYVHEGLNIYSIPFKVQWEAKQSARVADRGIVCPCFISRGLVQPVLCHHHTDSPRRCRTATLIVPSQLCFQYISVHPQVATFEASTG